MTTVTIGDAAPACYAGQRVRTDTMTPQGAALAVHLATSTAQSRWVRLESDRTRREMLADAGKDIADYAAWYTDAQLDERDTLVWEGWWSGVDRDGEPVTESSQTATEWLEYEARKLPIGYHVAGSEPDRLLNRSRVLALLREIGRPIAPSTWSSYTARGQAPAPARYVGRTPLWDADVVRAWATR